MIIIGSSAMFRNSAWLDRVSSSVNDYKKLNREMIINISDFIKFLSYDTIDTCQYGVILKFLFHLNSDTIKLLLQKNPSIFLNLLTGNIWSYPGNS